MSTYKGVSDWYDKKYRESGDDTRRSVKAFFQIEKMIPEGSNGILDVGCGRGEFLEYLSKKGFRNLAAIDISEEAIAFVKKILPDCDARVSIGEKMPFDNDSFELILCLGVLEHFLDIEGGIKEMQRVLKPGGKALIMVPNKDFIGWIFTGSEDAGTQQKEISETLYPVRKWQSLLEKNGLKVRSISVDKGFIYNNYDLKTKNVKYFLKRLLFLTMPLIPKSLSYQVIFEAEKTVE